MKSVKVISLGGSILAPDAVNIDLIGRFSGLVEKYLSDDAGRRLIIVVGGGGPARTYQRAYREIVAEPVHETQDRIGIAATRLNAQLLAGVLEKYCLDPVVTDPTGEIGFSGRILVAAGWKPGFSTDFDAVLLAERFSADTVINLSNIKKVYTADPKIDPQAEPIDNANWTDFKRIVGEEWIPGRNLPFDPVATKKAAELRLRVIVAAGNDIGIVESILYERPFEGTIIGPE